MDPRGSGDGAPLLEARHSRESGFTLEDLELQDPLQNQLQDTFRRSKKAKIYEYATLLLPSFLTYKAGGTPSPCGEWYPTAFLDGLRGVACIAVFNDHIMVLIAKWAAVGWGLDEGATRFWQLPIVRLTHSGHLAVLVFFIISGFALSVNTVKLMQTQPRDPAAFARLMTSSIFRRPLRLFLPVWASTLPVFLLTRLRIYEAADAIRESDILDGWPRPHPLNDTIGLQVLDVLRENTRMVNIFRPVDHADMRNEYNYPTWTIPIELRASLILYLTHAATFNLSRRVRTCVLGCILLYAMIFDQLELPLFWAGYMLAEWFFTSPPSISMQNTSILSRAQTPLALFLFVVGLWMGSYPSFFGSITPGYIWLGALTPSFQTESFNWWHTVGAVCIVGVLVRCPASGYQPTSPTSHLNKLSFRLQTMPLDFLSSPVCRYLGKISFALYLTHAMIVDTVAVVVFYCIWNLTGTENALLAGLGFVLAYILTFASVIWTADLFWRFVDQPCVHFARWLEKRWSTH